MELGATANDGAGTGKPLDGVRVLALEQMQSLPWCTQLLGRLGADVVKVEHPTGGDSARGSQPAMTEEDGSSVGATFLRNNLGKRSIAVNLKHPEGRDLVLALARRFDVVAQNFKAGTVERMGLGYADVAAVHPRCVYLSISGFGTTVASPYDRWPAFAPIVEAMSGIYEFKRTGDDPPLVAPVGALGDIGAGLFATVGVLAALRHRDQTGIGQHVDVAMLDAMVAMTDIVTNFWSMGLKKGELGPLIMHGFRASDGWFILQVGREAHFAKLVEVIGHPEWATDPRFATRQGWLDHLETVLRPAIEGWAAGRSKVEVCDTLAAAGVAAGPSFSAEDVVHDAHVEARDMLVKVPRTDGVAEPVLVPGNPVKLSAMREGPETRPPRLGQDTDELLHHELDLTDTDTARLRADGVIG